MVVDLSAKVQEDQKHGGRSVRHFGIKYRYGLFEIDALLAGRAFREQVPAH